MSKRTLTVLLFALVGTGAIADLELTVDIEYPKRIELKIPVKEDSDFEMRTSFGRNEFFSATGHVGRVTGLLTNRSIDLSYGYSYDLGSSKGSSTGSQTQPLSNSNVYSLRVVASIWAANPAFVIREVPPPVSPALRFTNMTLITNITPRVPK